MSAPRNSTDIPLDKNESYWLLDEKLLALCKEFRVRTLSTYPDYDVLKEKIASYIGVRSKQICITPGSDAAIEIIARTLMGPGEKALLPVPTFYGYESILTRANIAVVPLLYKEVGGAFIFPQEEFVQAITHSKSKAAFLCSPNNPLGISFTKDDTEHILAAAHTTLDYIISDEAYFGYSGYTMVPYLREHKNLIILRTFSKDFGIAGARIGYCIGSPSIISKLEKQLLPWPVSHLSYCIASMLLDNESYVRERRELVHIQKDLFIAELRQIPSCVVYPSEANFILIRIPNSHELVGALAKEGINVKNGQELSQITEAKHLLNSTIRMAIPSSADMLRVVKCIKYFANK